MVGQIEVIGDAADATWARPATIPLFVIVGEVAAESWATLSW